MNKIRLFELSVSGKTINLLTNEVPKCLTKSKLVFGFELLCKFFKLTFYSKILLRKI